MTTMTSPGANRWVVPGRHTSILRHGEQVDAIRHLGSPANPISVFASPTSKVKELVEFGNLDGRPLTYILQGSASAYIGVSGNGERRLADQIKARPKHSKIYVVCFNDPHVEMKAARYFEVRYIQLADNAGTKLTNETRPKIPEISHAERADYERLVHESLFPLYDATCTIFEERQRSARSKSDAVEDVEAKVVFGSVQLPRNPQTFELKARAGMWARGVAANERFYIMPGSDYWCTHTKTLDRSYRVRREELEQKQVLGAIKGVADRKRLLVWLDCGSAAIAAKILTGWRVNGNVWKNVTALPLVFGVKDFINGGGKRR